MALSDAQHRVHAWISQFEEGYFHPLTNLARLTEEVGELAREINHRFGQKTKKKEEPEGDLEMEIADIVFVLICIANREGIDLDAAFDRMMAKVETRDEARWTKKAGVSLLPVIPSPSAPSPAHSTESDSSRAGPRQ